MADSRERAELATTIAMLRKQQVKDLEVATYVGWTAELHSAHEERATRIELLLLEAAFPSD